MRSETSDFLVEQEIPTNPFPGYVHLLRTEQNEKEAMNLRWEEEQQK
jgi:hypothetical protein